MSLEAGEMHVNNVDVRKVAPTTASPNLHDIPVASKLVPVTATTVPPVVEPADGKIEATVDGGR